MMPLPQFSSQSLSDLFITPWCTSQQGRGITYLNATQILLYVLYVYTMQIRMGTVVLGRPLDASSLPPQGHRHLLNLNIHLKLHLKLNIDLNPSLNLAAVKPKKCIARHEVRHGEAYV